MDDSQQDNRTDVLEYIDTYNEVSRRSTNVILLSTNIIAPIGLLLNFFFLYTVIQVKSMHTIINIYLSNLAVADSLYLFLLFIYSLFSFADISVHNNRLYRALCVSRLMFQSASHLFIVTIATQRFSAVHHPLTFRQKASKCRAGKISAGLWVVIITIGVTVIFLPISQDVFNDIIFWNDFIIAIVCLTVTFALYSYTVMKICNQGAQLPTHLGQASKVLRMVIINTAVFYVLNTLAIATAVIYIIAESHSLLIPSQAIKHLNFLTKMYIVGTCVAILQLINSSIDPLVYSATNSDYRTAVVQAFSFLKLCSTCYPRQNPSRPSQPREQIELHVIPQPQNDQQHHAVRPSSSSKPPSQGLAQHTQSQQPLHSCQQQCSRPSSSKTFMHSQQHGLVHAHVHAEPAGIPALASSHQEQCSSLTDSKPSMQGGQCVHPEPVDSQQSLASTQEQCPGLTDTELSA